MNSPVGQRDQPDHQIHDDRLAAAHLSSEWGLQTANHLHHPPHETQPNRSACFGMDYLQREALVRSKAQPGRPLDVSGPGRTSMELARPEGRTSNSPLDTLADWSAYLEWNARTQLARLIPRWKHDPASRLIPCWKRLEFAY
jgi:hypothetical protein